MLPSLESSEAIESQLLAGSRLSQLLVPALAIFLNRLMAVIRPTAPGAEPASDTGAGSVVSETATGRPPLQLSDSELLFHPLLANVELQRRELLAFVERVVCAQVEVLLQALADSECNALLSRESLSILRELLVESRVPSAWLAPLLPTTSNTTRDTLRVTLQQFSNLVEQRVRLLDDEFANLYVQLVDRVTSNGASSIPANPPDAQTSDETHTQLLSIVLDARAYGDLDALIVSWKRELAALTYQPLPHITIDSKVCIEYTLLIIKFVTILVNRRIKFVNFCKSCAQLVVTEQLSTSNQPAAGEDERLGKLTLTHLELRGAYVSEREQTVRPHPVGALLGGRQSRAQPVALVLAASLSPADDSDAGVKADGEKEGIARSFACPVQTSLAGDTLRVFPSVSAVLLQCSPSDKARLELETSLRIQTFDS